MKTSDRLVLGIETSCDDTAVALVQSDGTVIAAQTASQTDIHTMYGGVYPELASRAHVDKIIPTVQSVIEQSGVRPSELASIGVTRGPGLIGSLIVGVNTARGLGDGWQVPVIGVNHLRGHLRSAELEGGKVRYPAVVLLVSGGHTVLAFMQDVTTIVRIGTTRDDSVGEAYDKVARMLGLGYPGGPIIDKMAVDGKVLVRFPRPMMGHGLDFSFSGLKSAVSRYLESEPGARAEDVAAAFVDACMDVLIGKCSRALAMYKPASLVVVGGVAASPQLRAEAEKLCHGNGVELCLPPLKWSTDNGAMIGLAAWDYLSKDIRLDASPNTSLSIEDF